jgi:hypothetical protein
LGFLAANVAAFDRVDEDEGTLSNFLRASRLSEDLVTDDVALDVVLVNDEVNELTSTLFVNPEVGTALVTEVVIPENAENKPIY